MSAVVQRCQKLENDELSVGGTVKLTATDYAELLLYYLVQQKLIEAKYCYLRASSTFKDDVLKQIWTIGYKLTKSDFGDALKACRDLHAVHDQLDAQLQPYVQELLNRVTAIQLELIVKYYTSIDQQTLIELLGFMGSDSQPITTNDSENFIPSLIEKCGWSSDEDGFVFPSVSAKFQETISALVDPNFGEIENQWKENKDLQSLTGDKGLSQGMIESLKSLVACSNFFDSS